MSIFDKEIETPIDIVFLISIGFKWFGRDNLYVKYINTKVNGVAYKIYGAKILAYWNSDNTWDFEVLYEFKYITNNFYRLTDLHDVEVLIENAKQYIVREVNHKDRKFPVIVTF